MRPPQASDHVVEPRLRILYTKKHAPYNSGEERVVAASIARRLCVLGIAIPAPKKAEINKQDETGQVTHVADELGGWSLSPDDAAAREERDRAKKEAAGDYKDQVKDEEAARQNEEQRVVSEADAKAEKQKDDATEADNKDKEKKTRQTGFLRGRTSGKT